MTESKRKAFNFLASYKDIYEMLENDKDKVAYIDAILNKQFHNIEPKMEELSTMVKMAYVGQKHNLDKSVQGWEKATKETLQGESETPCKANQKHPIRQIENALQEEEEKEEEEVQGEEEEKDKKKKNNILMSEIKISDLEDFEIDCFKISKAFQDLFIKNIEEKGGSSEKIKKEKYKKFTNPIRLMIEKDKISKDQMQEVFKFLDSERGSFWKPIILHTEKLRKQFNQLILKSKTPDGSFKNDTRTIQEVARDAYNSEAAKNFSYD